GAIWRFAPTMISDAELAIVEWVSPEAARDPDHYVCMPRALLLRPGFRPHDYVCTRILEGFGCNGGEARLFAEVYFDKRCLGDVVPAVIAYALNYALHQHPEEASAGPGHSRFIAYRYSPKAHLILVVDTMLGARWGI
ncbi:hypothetical protein EV122DRAFT_170574, partial [Schizophyllum commune]